MFQFIDKKNIIFLSIIIIIIIFLSITKSIQKDNNKELSNLRDLGKNHDLLIGSAVNGDSLKEDKSYRNIIKREFSILTPENEMKFSEIHPNKDTYDFSRADRIVKFAMKNNIKVRGHTLVWNKRIPYWLEKGNYTQKEMEQILKEHIFTVMKHYKGKIYAWDVVNEAFNDDGTLKDSIWLRTIGPDYIKKSFEWAKEADPSALLFYNDYSAETINPKSNAIYEMIKEFKEENVPIDGIGFQFHTSLFQKFNEEDLYRNMERFSKLGIKINITELDVKTSDMNALPSIKLQKQAKQYSIALKSCINLGNSCTVFGMWGFTDKYTWLKNDSPLIFDEKYKKKPSYYALEKILSH